MTTRPMDEREKPVVQLTGTDGNAFAIMGAVEVAMRKAGWTREEIIEVMDNMVSGNYDHLVAVVFDVCEVD